MLTGGHIVPRSVLNSLCCWRAGVPVEEHKKNTMLERCYMFRTDIKGGRCVFAEECTTKFNKLFCDTCEKGLEHIDRNASDFWKSFVKDWDTQPNFEVEVALASMMARAMCISQHLNQTELCRKLIEATKCKPKDSTHRLTEMGFLWYKLPPYRGYRVEFSFRCDVKVGQWKIPTVCAQVPPFFCLLPFKREPAYVLEHYIHIIAKALRTKLDNILKEFCIQATKSSDCERMMSNFSQWYTIFDTNGPGPLLVFDYLGSEILEVNIQIFYTWSMHVIMVLFALFWLFAIYSLVTLKMQEMHRSIQ